MKKLLIIFLLSLVLFSCQENNIEQTDLSDSSKINEPDNEHITLISYKKLHHYIYLDEEVTSIDDAALILTGPSMPPFDALSYFGPFLDVIEVDSEFLGLHQEKGVGYYYKIGELDGFDVYEWLIEINRFQVNTAYLQYESQTHQFYSNRYRLPLLFEKNDNIYHLNELIDLFDYNIDVLAHIFKFSKVSILDSVEVLLDIPDRYAISYEHIFTINGLQYTLSHIQNPQFLGADFLTANIDDLEILYARQVYDQAEYKLYYPEIYYQSKVIYRFIKDRTLFHKQYMFNMGEYAYYFSTRHFYDSIPYYIYHNDSFHEVEDILKEDIMTFDELNYLIKLQRELAISD